MRAAGYTAVGEFHYLGVEEARAAAEAAEEAGIAFVLLHVAYARGGIERFRQPSVEAYLDEVEELRADGLRVGVAPHSVRACPRGLARGDRRATPSARGSSSTSTRTSSRARSRSAWPSTACGPIELLARTGCLGPRTTIVHGTHASDAELDLLADAGARICVCPTTEANLGDGFAPGRADPRTAASGSASARTRTSASTRSRSCASSRASPAARRCGGCVVPPEELLAIGTVEGAAALGLDAWADVEIDLGHRSLAGVEPGDVPAALVFGCGADVVAPPL